MPSWRPKPLRPIMSQCNQSPQRPNYITVCSTPLKKLPSIGAHSDTDNQMATAILSRERSSSPFSDTSERCLRPLAASPVPL